MILQLRCKYEFTFQTLASIVRHGGRDQPSVPLPSENESAMDLDFINSDRLDFDDIFKMGKTSFQVPRRP